MRTASFDYVLPPDLIAQEPCEPRDQARLFKIERGTNNFSHHIFADIGDFLRSGDVLVLNNSKVLPARLQAQDKTGRKFEILLLTKKQANVWEVLIRPGKKIRPGAELFMTPAPAPVNFTGRLEEKLPGGTYLVRFNLSGNEFFAALDKVGQVPLPPYITKSRATKNQYQTVYADPAKLGSAAAPTAGFHFTPRLLTALQKKGVQIEYVTLHVGLGTFQPIRTERVEDHVIHSEYYELDAKTAQRITQAKKEQRRIIAVGTTATRVLETFGTTAKLTGQTNIYIYPGYAWKIIDGLITNFHLPRTSLLALVAAFVADPADPTGGPAIIRNAYAEAIKQRYRFYSFGDAMLII